MDKAVRAQVGQTHGQPNFIRNHCAEQFYDALPIVQAVIYGGLVMKRGAAKKLREAGVPVTNDGLMFATIDQRLKAIELLGKFGLGVRTDHTSGDKELANGVIEMPPWADDVEYEEVTETPIKGALPSGNGRARGNGKGNGKPESGNV